MKYLICLDLDGCLLNDLKQIGQKTIDCIKLCKQNGCLISFNTTRNYNRVKKYLPLIQPDYINCLCGSLVRKCDGEELFNTCINPEQLNQIFQITNSCSELKLVCSEWEDEEFVTDKEFAVAHNKKFLSQNEIQTIKSQKLIYLFDNPPPQDVLEKLKNCNINLTISTKNKYIRIMPNRDKWDGIQVVLNDLNQKDIQVISFGNDMSDLITLQNSDFGVAMSNSCEELLMQAKNVTRFSNNQDGIADYLNNLFKLNH